MRRTIFVFCLILVGGATCAAEQTRPDSAAVDELVRLGTVATLAPLCGMRDEAWAFDLRRASILEATRAARPDDPALKSAPGSDLVVSTLSFAEAEALETYAASTPAETCSKLAANPALAQADTLIQQFRDLKLRLKPSS